MWLCICRQMDEADHVQGNAPLFPIRATMPASALPHFPRPAQDPPSPASPAGQGLWTNKALPPKRHLPIGKRGPFCPLSPKLRDWSLAQLHAPEMTAEISINYSSGHTLRTPGNHEHLAVWLHKATIPLGHSLLAKAQHTYLTLSHPTRSGPCRVQEVQQKHVCSVTSH